MKPKQAAKVHRILIVDDQDFEREMLGRIFSKEGYDVKVAEDGVAACQILKQGNSFDVVIADIKMPKMDGLELLKFIKREHSDAYIILMTAYGSVETAVQAMKEGAFDYITKPFNKEELKIIVERAIKNKSIIEENRLLREELEKAYRLDNIIGRSDSMRKIYETMERIAPIDSTIIIYGENGTGKELIARAIHQHSPRNNHNFVPVDCASIPETLMESELFGYEKGAFTGASSRKIGLFEEADGGTLFLDEIGDLDINLQAKLLRTLQEREVRRVGGTKPIKIDVRIIAATNKDIEKEVRNGNFREDLYYRLNVVPIFVPPLRQRKEDIPFLVNHFLSKFGKKMSKTPLQIDKTALEALMQYDWPGNIRQLENVIERAFVSARNKLITIADLPSKIGKEAASFDPYDISIPDKGFSLKTLEKRLIKKALEKAEGSQKEAARLLGLSYKTLQYRIKKFGLWPNKPPDK